MLFEDFDGGMVHMLLTGKSYVHPDARGVASFKELDVADKQDRKSLHYFLECDMDKLHSHISKARIDQQQKVLMIPFMLQSKIDYMPFKGVNLPDQMVDDMRSENEKDDDKNDIPRSTLKP